MSYLSPIRGDQPRSPSTIYLGLDVHKDSITVAVLPAGTATPTHVDRLSVPQGQVLTISPDTLSTISPAVHGDDARSHPARRQLPSSGLDRTRRCLHGLGSASRSRPAVLASRKAAAGPRRHSISMAMASMASPTISRRHSAVCSSATSSRRSRTLCRRRYHAPSAAEAARTVRGRR